MKAILIFILIALFTPAQGNDYILEYPFIKPVVFDCVLQEVDGEEYRFGISSLLLFDIVSEEVSLDISLKRDYQIYFNRTKYLKNYRVEFCGADCSHKTMKFKSFCLDVQDAKIKCQWIKN